MAEGIKLQKSNIPNPQNIRELTKGRGLESIIGREGRQKKRAPGIRVWDEDPLEIVDRKEEINLFNTYLSSMGEQGLFINIAGSPGIGKTILLKRLMIESTKRRFLSIFISANERESKRTIETKIINGIKATLSEMMGEGRGNFREINPLLEKEEKDVGRMINRVHRILKDRIDGIVIFLDDGQRAADDIVAYVYSIEKQIKSEWMFGLVVASTKSYNEKAFLKKHPELDGRIKEFRLKEFSIKDVEELIERSLKGSETKIGHECIKLLHKESSGNPKVFKLIGWYLLNKLKGREKMITKAHYLAYFPSIMNFLSYEFFDGLYSKLSEGEREIAKEIASREMGGHEGVYVSDISKKLKRSLGVITGYMLRLMEKGQVVKVSRGRYRLFCRLYAKYIIKMS